MRLLLLSLLALTTASLPIWAQCSPALSTNIYFGNGVNKTVPEAQLSLQKLRMQVLATISGPPSLDIDAGCLMFTNAYDSKFFNRDNSNAGPLQTFNLLLQVLGSAGIQVTQQFLSQIWLWLGDDNGPSWFDQTIGNSLLNVTAIFQPDLQAQVQHYTNDLNTGVKDVLVAHSQGNLYGNQAYGLLSPTIDQFNMISVATPANFVSGNGPYVTLEHDVILLVPGSLPANTSNNPSPADPCGSDNYISLNGGFRGIFPLIIWVPGVVVPYSTACHSFDESYLQGTISSASIISDVIQDIRKVGLLVKHLGNTPLIDFDVFLTPGSIQLSNPFSIGPDTSINIPIDATALQPGVYTLTLRLLDTNVDFSYDLQLGTPGLTFQSVISGPGTVDSPTEASGFIIGVLNNPRTVNFEVVKQ